MHSYLLYDKSCPLCVWYTEKFVRFGFMKADERVPYEKGENLHPQLDYSRASNEIALVDSSSGKIKYGIDSLLSILGRKIPIIESVGSFKPVHWLLRQLYSFVSYNRKIVAPANCEGACVPSYNLYWRLAFIVIMLMGTSILVSDFYVTWLSNNTVHGAYFVDWPLMLGLTATQVVAFVLMRQDSLITYLGHFALVSFVGALLLTFAGWGFIAFQAFAVPLGSLPIATLGVVTGIMLLMHVNRVKLLGHTKWLTISWLMYRIVLFPIVFVV